MTQAIVVINSGSTGLKFAAYATGDMVLLCGGELAGMLDHPRFSVKACEGKALGTHDWGASQTIDHNAALRFVLSWTESHIAGFKIVAVGHRVVKGDECSSGPARIDPEILKYLDGLSVVEPSHQPYNMRGVAAIAESFPGLAQVASYDTSFHRSMPDVAQIYAIEKTLRDAGLRHWRYHGIFYDYISRRVKKAAPSARRVIAAHLVGAPVCAPCWTAKASRRRWPSPD